MKRLTGINPLAYLGVEPYTPAQIEIHNRPPTLQDRKNYNVGTIWIDSSVDPADREVYLLVKIIGADGYWIKLSGGGGAGGLLIAHTDAGDAVLDPADSSITWTGGTLLGTTGAGTTVTTNLTDGGAGQFIIGGGGAGAAWADVVAGAGIAVTPGVNTFTITNTAPGAALQFTTDAGIANPAAGNINVLGGTLINTVGAAADVTVNLTDGGAGQVIIGGGGAGAAWADLVAGAGIGITPGVNTITITNTSPGGVGTVTSVNAGENINLTGTAADPIVNLDKDIKWTAGSTLYRITVEDILGTTYNFLTQYHGASASVALGFRSGPAGIMGGHNVFLGASTGRTSTSTAVSNTLVGDSAGAYLTGGDYNVYMGASSGLNATDSTYNTAVGYRTLDAASTNHHNSAFGHEALTSLTTGQYNTSIGKYSGRLLTTGSSNTYLGYYAGGGHSGAESDNVCIASAGLVGDSALIRIRDTATTTAAYMGGIYGKSAPATPRYVTVDSNHKLGSTALPSGETSFFAFLNTNYANVTGDGTYYYLGSNALTELYDYGGDFTPYNAGGAYFTAPTTGLYVFSVMTLITNLVVPAPPSPTYIDPLDIIVTGTYARTYSLVNPILQFLGTQSIFLTVLALVSAGGTVKFRLGINITGVGKTLGIGKTHTWCSGYLLNPI